MTTTVRSPAVRSPADPRGTGFRPTEPEAMGSVSGTDDLALADPEPDASEPLASGPGRVVAEPQASEPHASEPHASGRIPGVTGATWI
jgi:hypothetical protein